MKKIDALGFAENPNSLISSALSSMADFFNIGVVNNQRVTKKSVELFLNDKGQEELVAKLNEKFSGDENSKYLISDFEEILCTAKPKITEIVEEVEEESIPVEEEDIFEEEIEEEEISDEQLEHTFSFDTSQFKSSENSYHDVIDVTETEEENHPQGESEEEFDFLPDNEEETHIHNDTLSEAMELAKEEVQYNENDLSVDDSLANERMVISEDEEVFDAFDKKEEPVEETEPNDRDVHIKFETVSPEDMVVEDEFNEWQSEKVETLSEDDFVPEDSSVEFEEIPESVEEGTKTELKPEPDEPVLFNEDDFTVAQPEEKELEEVIEEESAPPKTTPDAEVDISELLEHKKMTKIIEVLFDYDMEEFANTIERISECDSEEEAERIIEEICQINHVSPSSKEVKTFKSIILEYFDRT